MAKFIVELLNPIPALEQTITFVGNEATHFDKTELIKYLNIGIGEYSEVSGITRGEPGIIKITYEASILANFAQRTPGVSLLLYPLLQHNLLSEGDLNYLKNWLNELKEISDNLSQQEREALELEDFRKKFVL